MRGGGGAGLSERHCSVGAGGAAVYWETTSDSEAPATRGDEPAGRHELRERAHQQRAPYPARAAAHAAACLASHFPPPHYWTTATPSRPGASWYGRLSCETWECSICKRASAIAGGAAWSRTAGWQHAAALPKHIAASTIHTRICSPCCVGFVGQFGTQAIPSSHVHAHTHTHMHTHTHTQYSTHNHPLNCDDVCERETHTVHTYDCSQQTDMWPSILWLVVSARDICSSPGARCDLVHPSAPKFDCVHKWNTCLADLVLIILFTFCPL